MFKKYIGLFKDAGRQWWSDKADRLGAALAFYSVLSLGPLLLIVVSVVALWFGDEGAQGRLLEEARNLLGEEGAQTVGTLLKQNPPDRDSGMIATGIGLITLLFTAGGVFGQLQDALNTIWKVSVRPGRSLFNLLRARFLSFGMVVGTGFLLLVSLVLSATLSAMGDAAVGMMPQFAPLLQLINIVVSFFVVALLFALIFKIMPDAHVAWRDVWQGAFLTSALFGLGKWLIGLYLGHSSVASAYGAAGSLLVVLIWIYYSAQILLFGAEFTRAYAERYGSRIVPSKHAVSTDEPLPPAPGISPVETIITPGEASA